MSEFINIVREAANGSLNGVSDAVILALIFVGGLLIIASIVALVISIYLAISYVKYNRKRNSSGKTGEEIEAQVHQDARGRERLHRDRQHEGNVQHDPGAAAVHRGQAFRDRRGPDSHRRGAPVP